MSFRRKKTAFLCVIAMSLIATHSHGQIIALNQNFPVSLPISLGGADIQPSTQVGVSVSDIQFDPNTNTVRSVTRDQLQISSNEGQLSETFDTNLDLPGSGFEGFATSEAGGDEVRTQMEISNINVDPGDGVTLSSSSAEYQLLRFNSAEDTEIDVDVTYLLTGSVTAETGSLPVSASALAAMRIFDLGSFNPSFEEDGFLWGTADVAIFDLLSTSNGPAVVDTTESFRAITNRDYAVLLLASASVAVSDLIESAAVDIAISASADPVFGVDDPNVDIVRSILTSEVQPVPEPGSFGLLGLGLVGLAFARCRRR